MKYIIVTSEDNTRDTQIYVGAQDNPDKTYAEDDWRDCPSSEMFVGIYDGPTESEAIAEAGHDNQIPTTSLRAISVDSDPQEDTEQCVINLLNEYYELDDDPGSDSNARFFQEFHMNPNEMRANKNKILTKGAELYFKYENSNVPENDTWDFVRTKLQELFADEGGQDEENRSVQPERRQS